MISAAEIRTADPRDEAPVVSTLVAAFSDDPAARWVYTGAREYLTFFPDFVMAFAGRAFTHGTAHYMEDGVGAALWLPPGVEPDEEKLVSLLERTTPSGIRDDVFGVFEQMGSYRPQEPHWYLPLIGVAGPYQGRGYGSVLLQHSLAECDRQRMPAYLESSNPRNISLYERHGFEVIGSIQAGSSPLITPMLRKPRTF